MRVCPACAFEERDVVFHGYDETGFSLYRCHQCAMMYVDRRPDFKEVDQSWFDEYYLHVYSMGDGDLANPRLKAMADFIRELTAGPVLDIGGEDGKLSTYLKAHGVPCDIAGIRDRKGRHDYPAVVLSHTLEHIYDVPAMMKRIRSHMAPVCRLYIECPIWLDENLADPAHYDWHFQHVNKFTLVSLEKTLTLNGFEVMECHRIDDYLEYHCGRAIAR